MIVGIIFILLAWFAPMPVWVSIVTTVLAVAHIGWRMLRFFWSEQDYD